MSKDNGADKVKEFNKKESKNFFCGIAKNIKNAFGFIYNNNELTEEEKKSYYVTEMKGEVDFFKSLIRSTMGVTLTAGGGLTGTAMTGNPAFVIGGVFLGGMVIADEAIRADSSKTLYSVVREKIKKTIKSIKKSVKTFSEKNKKSDGVDISKMKDKSR